VTFRLWRCLSWGTSFAAPENNCHQSHFVQLQTLYTEEAGAPEVEIDLDEVLDIEDDNLRKKFIRDILTDSKSSREVINTFVEDLLERAKTL